MLYRTILAIESSCDETAAAVVRDGVETLSSYLASSADVHEKTGGVVPEVAARKQVEYIIPVISETLTRLYIKVNDKVPADQKELTTFSKDFIDAVAVTIGPGLIGSLVVGVEAAKALCVAWNKSAIPVNHLVGHVYGNFLDTESSTPAKELAFPAVVLVVSGGHTDLVLMKGHGKFEYLGGTLDDAAGEAFDKTARLMGITKYLMGGPSLSARAFTCINHALANKLPRPMIDSDNFDFSFSGLKSAVKRLYSETLSFDEVSSLAKDFENSVVEVLTYKTMKAVKKYGAASLLICGGVAANRVLRESLKIACDLEHTPFFVPPLPLCGDNAVYIASAAFFNQNVKELDKIKADPSLGVMD